MKCNLSFVLLLGMLFCMILAVQGKRRNSTSKDNNEPLASYPQSRIFGGGNAYSDTQFPYQVSLRLYGTHICGGAIISPNYVVTAAHCISITKATADRLTIKAGSISINSGGQTVRVSEIKIHPSYDRSNNDIALLRLATPLQYNDRVKPIGLTTQAPPSGAPVVVSGWGRTSTNGPTSDTLKFVTMTALSLDECRPRHLSVRPSVLCLLHPQGHGICAGDSGGPAVYNNKLVGVANYQIDGCGSSFPDGYASVAVQYNWLKSNSDV